MHKELVLREELNPKITSGLSKIASMVKRTLGPGGLPIIIQRVGQAINGEPLGPKITKDGVSVANECASTDEYEDLIIQAVKHICKKTNSQAGDGTTTAIVLGEAIVNETLKLLESDNSLNPQLVKESLEQAAKEVLEELTASAMAVSTIETVKQVASISANGDQEIGDVLSQAFDKVGAEGVVTVDEGSTNHITLEVVDGYQINRGAEAQNRFFNNKDNTRFEAENAAVVIYDGDLMNYTDIIPTINKLTKQENGSFSLPPIVFLANSFSQEVIQFLLIQKAEAGLQFCAVKGPHTTTVRTGYYDDIAVLTGGTRLGNGARSLKNFQEDEDNGDAGLVGKVVVDKYKCTFYDCQGSEEDILERVDQLKALRQLAESPYDAQVVSDRIAALTGGVAKIGVGGSTDFEIKEKYDRIEDALNASRAAIQEGIVPGGGVALLKISDTLDKIKNKTVGQSILAKALKYPFYQILTNIGEKNHESLAQEVIMSKSKVFDARTKSISDYMEAGILDPVKVTKAALENAVSIASLLSTAGGGIVYIKDK